MPIPSEGSRSSEVDAQVMQRRRRLVFDAARAQWPGVEVEFDHFCRELERLGYHEDQPAHAAALYVCMACARGCNSACRALEERYFPGVRALLANFDARSEVVDELLQQVRHRLFVGPNPRIRTYNGRGAFQAWLRKVAQTLAVDDIRANIGRERRTRRLDKDIAYVEVLCSAAPPPPDEQADRERYGHIVEQSLCHALQSLSNEQRRLVHLYYVAGMSIDQLGLVYAVDRSTVARRVGRVVQEVQRNLRMELTRRLGSLAANEVVQWEILRDRVGGGIVGSSCPALPALGDPLHANCPLELDAGASEQ